MPRTHSPPPLRPRLRGRGRLGIAVLGILALTACTTADQGAIAGGSGDDLSPPDRTERLAAACNGCHGVDGSGSGAMPALAGRDSAFLAARLRTWRDAGTGSGPDHLMVRFAQALDDTDIDALARHYAALPPGTTP
ncbi:MAG TPA: c-type cytochrome [Pseudomonadales bacterium]|nr:c-type cytochrome [Pseudomonadales bacterium]